MARVNNFVSGYEKRSPDMKRRKEREGKVSDSKFGENRRVLS